MRKHVLPAFVAGLLLAMPGAALAQDEAGGHIYAGITGGTLGIGPEVGYRLSERFGVRASASFLGVNHEFDSDEITYDGSVDLESYGAMVDVYPFGGGFRISGGFRINNNRAKASGQASNGGTFEINGTSYDSTTLVTSVDADAEVDDFAPALTIGYAGGNRSGFVFGIEAGALFQGSVKIKPLTISGTCATTTSDPLCATIATDLEAERQSVQKDVDDYKVYPIVQLTVGYRF